MTLVDTSVWIDGFHGGKFSGVIKNLIDRYEICINDLILSELIPSIRVRKEKELEDLLYLLPRVPMQIDWNGIVSIQTENLKNGINRVGLPDIMIAQNAMQNGVQLLSMDKHFELMAKVVPLQLYPYTPS
jgi:hypothetical protein